MNPREDARLGGRHFDVNLVGLELHEQIADGDGIPALRSHLATRASTIDSPTSGTTMFDGISILVNLSLGARERRVLCPLLRDRPAGTHGPGLTEGLVDERLLVDGVARRG